MRFGSREWIEAVVAALHAQPDLGRALDGLGRDGALIVEAEPPRFPATVAVHAAHERGRLVRWRLLADEDEVLELEPAYVLRAPYRVWRELLQGGDPVQAALGGRLRVEGDLGALVRKANYRYVVEAALRAVPTELP